MGKRFGLLVALVALTMVLAGCFVHHPGPPPPRHRRYRSRPACGPGHYWDGHRCRRRGRHHHHHRY